jgi:hypothetical protein
MLKNKIPDRYIVLFPGYNPENENCNNYVSYSTQLDNIPGMTKSYSQAVAAATKYNGTIYQQVDNVLSETAKKNAKYK